MTYLGHIGFEFQDVSVDVSDKHEEAHRMYHEAYEAHVGDIFHGPVEVETDNSGARDLCRRTTVGGNSKHVERKVFKMRELQHDGKVRVGLVPTADNAADIFTKPLPNKVFAQHRATIYNFAAQRDLPRVNASVCAVRDSSES